MYWKNISFKKLLKKNTGNQLTAFEPHEYWYISVKVPYSLLSTLKLPLENVKSYTGMHA